MEHDSEYEDGRTLDSAIVLLREFQDSMSQAGCKQGRISACPKDSNNKQ